MKWIDCSDLTSMDREDSCCFPREVERYGVTVVVFDEDAAEIKLACYDFRKNVWESPESGEIITGVTHWMPLPLPPQEQPCKTT